MNECIRSCCQKKYCDVAFMLGNDCYGVKCKTRHLCGTTPAKQVKKYRPRLAYMHSDIENITAGKFKFEFHDYNRLHSVHV